MKIAIIDSGIEKTHNRFKDCLLSGLSFKFENSNITIGSDYNDAIGHGTGVAGIIHKIVPDAQLVIVKVFHKELTTTEDILCEALNWCINQKEINLINLSLGVRTSNPSPKLFDLCQKAFNYNIPICSSAHYRIESECYPAYFDKVFGVTTGLVKKKLQYGTLKNNPIEFLAKGTLQRLPALNNSYNLSEGTSFACAHFTGIVAQIATQHKFNSIKELKDYLIKHSDKDIRPVQTFNNHSVNSIPTILSSATDKIIEKYFVNDILKNKKGLAAFPVSEKEVNTLVEFHEHCVIPLKKLLDFPRKVTFSNKSDKKERPQHLPIQDWALGKDDFSSFDSILLGFYNEQLFQGNIIFGDNLLYEAIASNKLIITFSKTLAEDIVNKNPLLSENVYCQIINKNHFNDFYNFRYFKTVSKPVLIVIGTSNRQGKFTTQLRIREILKREGYRVSHLSTEPQGKMLGAEFSFPYGYGGHIELSKDKWSIMINNVLKAIEYYCDPHIIISGTQGWIIPKNTTPDSESNHFNSLHYLSGIQADAAICAINPSDTLEDIRETFNVVRAFFKIKVLFCVMTPWNRNFHQTSNNWYADYNFIKADEFNKKLEDFSTQLQLPVIDILDKKNDPLILNLIESFFAKKD